MIAHTELLRPATAPDPGSHRSRRLEALRPGPYSPPIPVEHGDRQSGAAPSARLETARIGTDDDDAPAPAVATKRMARSDRKAVRMRARSLGACSRPGISGRRSGPRLLRCRLESRQTTPIAPARCVMPSRRRTRDAGHCWRLPRTFAGAGLLENEISHRRPKHSAPWRRYRATGRGREDQRSELAQAHDRLAVEQIDRVLSANQRTPR